MACDRFIHFKKGEVPSKDDVKIVLEDYLGAFMTKNRWEAGRWIAQLVGNKSYPFQRLLPDSNRALMYAETPKEDRWLEVYIDTDNIDVITRQADEVTMNIADGFAKLVVRYWKGKLEMDDDQVAAEPAIVATGGVKALRAWGRDPLGGAIVPDILRAGFQRSEHLGANMAPYAAEALETLTTIRILDAAEGVTLAARWTTRSGSPVYQECADELLTWLRSQDKAGDE